MSDIISMHRADLVDAVTEAVKPLKARIDSLEAELAAEKMQHSVTIADEHESRSEFQDRIRALEAERDDVVEARGEMARENVRLATELAEWRELYEFGLKDRNELLDRTQTAEAYAARNALRVIAVEAALTKLLLWGGTDFEDDEKREYALTGILEEAYQLVPVSVAAAETFAEPGIGPIEPEPQDYKVQCRCGWMGQVSTLKSLPEFKMGCPDCSQEFVPINKMAFPVNRGVAK